MKKIIGLFSLLIVSIMLAACGSTTATTNLDGDYVRYILDSETGEYTFSEDTTYGLEISNNQGIDKFESIDFTIDTEKKVITYLNKEGFSQFNEEFTYTFENDVLSYDDKTYVKVGSDKYKEIQAEVEKNQGEN